MIASACFALRGGRLVVLLVAATIQCCPYGCRSAAVDTGVIASTESFGVYVVCDDAEHATDPKTVSLNGERLPLCGETFLTAQHLLRASLTTSSDGRPSVLIQLTSEGESILRERSGQLIQHRIAIVVDDRVLGAPTVMSAVTKLMILGGTNALPDSQIDAVIERINTLASLRGRS